MDHEGPDPRADRAWWALVLALVLLCACKGRPGESEPFARYAAPMPDGGSIYFVGNSLLEWGGRGLPDWLAAFGAAQGLRFETGSDIVPGDLPLSAFLEHPAVKSALASRKYQVWIIQGHELEPVEHPERFEEAVTAFHEAIAASGGRMLLFMTWEFRWRRFMPELEKAYDAIGRRLGVPVIPAGLVYLDCEKEPPEGMTPFFLTASPERPDGDLHGNRLGTAANVYVTYAILTGRNPEGQAFPVPGGDIDPAMRRYLSDRAWARAAQRLAGSGMRECIDGGNDPGTH